MRSSRFLYTLLATAFFGAVLWLGTAFAGSCGGFWFNSNCDTISPYCTGDSCSIEKGVEATKQAVNGQLTDKNIAIYAQDIVMYLMTFISIIAVIYIIWAGFQLMVSGGDEEKMKKMRKIIIYVVLGIIVMWLAFPIVKWTINLITNTGLKTAYKWSVLPEANAATTYTESESDTYIEYKNRLKGALETMESEMRVNNQVSVSTIQNVKSLIQQAYDRLPNTGDMGVENESMKRQADMYLDLALKDPASTTNVGNAISRASSFIDRARINRIEGDISASPSDGNTPLSVSFRAVNVKDPSGTTPADNNYIWWIREAGGYRRELARGPSLSYTFTKEGNYTVFLDVVSGSRNSRGKVDVLPLSVSKAISVKPKLGEIVLLINGVNVSNMDKLKISPAVGKMGIILDASASRAIGNGTITDTTWDFGNGNQSTNRGAPIVERQIYANQGGYIVKLSMKTNDGQTISKEIQLLVREPAAVIKLDQKTAHIGEDVSMSAVSYFADNRNVDYTWQIQDENGQKIIKTGDGISFRNKFDKVGSYIVTLIAKSANGDMDQDSTTLTIESREPVVSIDGIRPIHSERPNTMVFDASKSYDPDTNSRKDLTYVWRIDGQKVDLDNLDMDGARGTYTFDSKGTHTVSVTVTNAYGKIATVERQLEVSSILAVNMMVSPQVVKQGGTVTLIGQSPNAEYFDWNTGDGEANITGNSRSIQHVYKRSGVYSATLTVNRDGGSETNSVTRKVYIADADKPLAIITASNSASNIIEEKNACGNGQDALIINRADSTTFDGSKSVNVDGNTSGLTYTWKYFGNAKTTSSISEKFNELGCFPIELTVRSDKTGASSTATQYIKLANRPPELTSVTSTIDSSKKDAQKVLVTVTANGARDPDGVITSYIWYYKTESDPEPQNIQISQKNTITFVLPNITEKYYFGVILEDNDGARVNSMDSGQTYSPLIIDNANGNIYLPLISLSVPKTNANVGEKVTFAVDAKTIIGTNITAKSEYAWDFDGDGRIDTKTSTPGTDHTYMRAGDYNMKVRVTYNGVSNSKYQMIHVRNKLKAAAHAYKLPDGRTLLLNASEGVYDKATWQWGNTNTQTPSHTIVDAGISSVKLTIGSNTNDSATADIDLSQAETMTAGSGGLVYQASPRLGQDAKITVQNPNDLVYISMYGNHGDQYIIDTNTAIDSNLDGIPDNDTDNQDTPSYTDGSVFTLSDFSNDTKRERTIRLTVMKNGVAIGKKDITLVLDFLSANQEKSADLTGSGISDLSDYDKAKLEELSALIRETSDADRIILTQRYNTLVENWNNPFDKAKSLIDLQEAVVASSVSTEQKAKLSKLVDEIHIGDAKNTDDISIAVKLVRDLIPKESPNHATLIEKLGQIESHPTLFKENKALAQEMLKLIETDTTIPDKYKIHIRDQLVYIINGGTAAPADTPKTTEKAASTSGIMGFISGFVKVFLILIGVILLIGILAYLFYRFSRKDENIGFQDFLIDSVFHSRKEPATPAVAKVTPVVQKEVPVVSPAPTVDPLKSYVPPAPTTVNVQVSASGQTDPLATVSVTTPSVSTPPATEVSVPDWLKPQSTDTTTVSPPPVTVTPSEPVSTTMADRTPVTDSPVAPEGLPDWLKPASTTVETESPLAKSETLIIDDAAPEQVSPIMTDTTPDTVGLPDWLIPNTVSTDISENTQSTTQSATKTTEAAKITTPEATPAPEITPAEDTLPDWLLSSIQGESSNTKILPESDSLAIMTPPTKKKETPKKSEAGKKSDDKKPANKKPATKKADTPDVSENTKKKEDTKKQKADNLPKWLQ